MNSTIVTIRARAFSSSEVSRVEVSVTEDGDCYVRDPISRTWTRCHALTAAEQIRAIRKARRELAAQAIDDREYAAGHEWHAEARS